VVYGEMWLPLEGCGFADWTTLGYLAPIDPALVPVELRATFHDVAMMWALNGRKFVVFLERPDGGGPGATLPWQAGRLPDSVVALADERADPDDVAALLDQLAIDHPAVAVDWLSELRVGTLGAAIGDFPTDGTPTAYQTIPQIEAAVAGLRASGLFGSIEWSGLVFRLPNEQRLVQIVDDAVLRPECLRAESRDLRDAGGFTTEPSLAAPLGPGIVPREPTCD
jgi:hypothetical protein